MMGKPESVLIAVIVANIFFFVPPAVADANSVSGNPELEEAYKLYLRAKMDDLKLTTDPNEVGEILTYRMLQGLAGQNRFDDIFNIGDEAFEKESDQRFGKGVGPIAADGSSPDRLQTMVGGSDSGSCRSCHFKGGPDGSGTLTSIAMLRSDGVHADTATHRDSPHLMGLGYIQIIAHEMTTTLKDIAASAQSLAMSTGKTSSLKLTAKKLDFGEITANADGTLDTAGVKHVRGDLVIRPFGHKGRADTLFRFVDEALQMHHGLQTDSRLEELKSRPDMVGKGPPWDPDQDGYQNEAAAGRTLTLAAYLSMLPIPSIKPPSSSSLAIAWGRGQKLFVDVGCASCHTPELRFKKPLITHQIPRFSEVKVTIDLSEHGQSPAPIRLDNGPSTDDTVASGTPIYPFTDLRLHDMGVVLADTNDEPNLEGNGSIGKSIWLTRSLWGLADTAPYLHDGRASTVEEAIVLHGGEATDVRKRFTSLGEKQRRSILVYLASLTREPTALIE